MKDDTITVRKCRQLASDLKMEPRGAMYLYAMLAVIAIVSLIAAPSLFRKKCHKCRARNGLDAKVCARCGEPFPEEA